MYRRTNSEWQKLYETLWRRPFAGLSKELRAKLVRGCRGKDVYQSPEEAEPIIAQMKVRPPLYLKCYACTLCHGYHIGNSRNANTLPQRLIVARKPIDLAHNDGVLIRVKPQLERFD